jgi:hypothetical protein
MDAALMAFPWLLGRNHGKDARNIRAERVRRNITDERRH